MKIQLTITISFFSSKDNNDEELIMHLKSDKIKTMISEKADKLIKKLFDSTKCRYQNNLQSMRGSEFVFDQVQLFYYKCHKTNLNFGGSYIDSPDWIKRKQQ